MKKVLLAIMVPALFAQAHADGIGDDEVIQRLESSGALDQAVERSLQRLGKKRQEAQAKAQQEAMQRASELARNARKVDVARDHMKGSPAAVVTIIEYSDYECPYCKRFYPEPDAVMTKFDKQVNVVWRHLPLPMHGEVAQMEAEAAECAARLGGNEAFWKLSDAIFANTATNGRGLAQDGNNKAALAKLASTAGLDGAAFETCLDKHETAAMIAEDVSDGEKAGVQGTPGVLVRNNRTGTTVALPGAVPVGVLEEAIGRELASPQAAEGAAVPKS